jgi:hypothetical protein
MTIWDALETPLDAAPRFFVEPRDKQSATELQRQQTFLAMLKRCAPSVFAMAMPNAGKRSDWERVQRWKEGAVKGAPDLVCCWNYGTAWLEFKSGTGALSSAQKDLLNRLHAIGHRVAMVRRPETALRLLAEWGAPIGAEALCAV